MNLPEDLREVLENAGITNLNNPDKKDLYTVLQLYVADRKLTTEQFTHYMDFAKISVEATFNALQEFSSDTTDLTSETLQIIRKAIGILEKELERDLVPEERKEIREQILGLISEARKEADKERIQKRWYVGVAAGVGVVVIGGAVMIASKGKNSKMLVKGTEMIGKAVRAAA